MQKSIVIFKRTTQILEVTYLTNMKEAITWLYAHGFATDIEYLLNDCKKYMQELVKSNYVQSDESKHRLKKACSALCRLNTAYRKATGKEFLSHRIAISNIEEADNTVKEFICTIL